MGHEPVHRAILAVDIEGFGRAAWTDLVRVRLRARLHRLLDRALAAAAVDPAAAHRIDTGDGALILVGADVPATRLLHPTVSALAAELGAHNRGPGRADGEAFRLRLAVHAGPVVPDRLGYAGEALNHAARLVDSRVGRAILGAVPGADAVLLVSESVYTGVVRHAYEGIDPTGYQAVWVSEKETLTRAWAHVPQLADQPRLDHLPEVAGTRRGPAIRRTPHELPRDVETFVGRHDELRRLDALGRRAGRTGAVVISAMDGMGGVGKSALAIHAAHRLAPLFPDGQLYLDLRGGTPCQEPLEPAAALDHLLRGLGVPAAEIPPDAAAAARWRSLAAGRRLLVVLDNAASAAQVEPLLPASGTNMVLVTSRRVLGTLGAAARLPLDLLPRDQAVELLERWAGPERVRAEPAAADAVAALCGYLPLALQLVGARLVRRQGWTLRHLADRLSSAARLDELQDAHAAVRSSVDVSYRELCRSRDVVDRRAARAFGLLSLVNTPAIDVAVAARLLDWTEPETGRVLERLADAQLLQSLPGDRYRFHDLLRLVAREHAVRDEPEAARTDAFLRVLDLYCATARQTSHLLQSEDRARAGLAADRRAALPLRDAPAAIDWLDREQENLLAVAAQAARLPAALAAPTVRLVLALGWGMVIRARWRDLEALGRLALPVARRLGDERAAAAILLDLGYACWRLARVDEGPRHLERALDAFTRIGDQVGQALALSGLAEVHCEQGRTEDARDLWERALRLCRAAARDRPGARRPLHRERSARPSWRDPSAARPSRRCQGRPGAGARERAGDREQVLRGECPQAPRPDLPRRRPRRRRGGVLARGVARLRGAVVPRGRRAAGAAQRAGATRGRVTDAANGQRPGADHGPTPPIRVGVIRRVQPGGGSAIGGNFTPGPR